MTHLRSGAATLFLLALLTAPAPHGAGALELVVCGWDDVFMWNPVAK